MFDDSALLATHPVRRMGFGAMQLPGPGVFGPPKDRDQALVFRVADSLAISCE
jgi:pyridoxine 4-dehydrogenase